MEDNREEAAQFINDEMEETELDEVSGGTKLDSLSEMNEEQQLRMQTQMEKMTKAQSAYSQLSKKFSDTASSITANLK